MFGMGAMPLFMHMEYLALERKAKEEGRDLTNEEIQAGFKRIFDGFVESGTRHTLAQMQAAEALRPKRGLFGWLF